jgi:hypothetical protein
VAKVGFAGENFTIQWRKCHHISRSLSTDTSTPLELRSAGVSTKRRQGYFTSS